MNHNFRYSGFLYTKLFSNRRFTITRTKLLEMKCTLLEAFRFKIGFFKNTSFYALYTFVIKPFSQLLVFRYYCLFDVIVFDVLVSAVQ